eukprot:COSAG06_NODE_28945_length_565_cov_0.834764_1_plen_93_part_01
MMLSVTGSSHSSLMCFPPPACAPLPLPLPRASPLALGALRITQTPLTSTKLPPSRPYGTSPYFGDLCLLLRFAAFPTSNVATSLSCFIMRRPA